MRNAVFYRVLSLQLFLCVQALPVTERKARSMYAQLQVSESRGTQENIMEERQAALKAEGAHGLYGFVVRKKKKSDTGIANDYIY